MLVADTEVVSYFAETNPSQIVCNVCNEHERNRKWEKRKKIWKVAVKIRNIKITCKALKSEIV